jgi:hypothetical protein
VNAPLSTAVVVLTPEQLRELVTSAVREALAEHAPAAAPELMDRAECARLLRLSLQQVDRLCKRGLPYSRVGDVKRFARSAVLAWVEAQP